MKAKSLNYWNESELNLKQDIFGDVYVFEDSTHSNNIKSYFQLNRKYRSDPQYPINSYNKEKIGYYYSSVLDLVDLINII